MNDPPENKKLTDLEGAVVGTIYRLLKLPKDPETGEYKVTADLKVKATEESIAVITKKLFEDQEKTLPDVLDSLVRSNMLEHENGEYTLTDEGRTSGKKIVAQLNSRWFDDVLVRSGESKAHGIFCERVFGKNLCQFNVLDMQQLELLLSKLKLNPGDRVLDLGCGLGKIAEYISVTTGTAIHGIDFAAKAIEWARENISGEGKLSFEVGDMNDLQLEAASFDAVYAIDTLYPWNVDDFGSTVKILKKSLKPRGQMGIFSAHITGPSGDESLLVPENTALGKALLANGLSFTTTDLTEASVEFWQRELAVAEDMKEMFEKEGSLDLCEQRIADSKNTLDNLNKKLQKRFFYHVQILE